ncbi:outer membrane protein assembly factor BamD [Geomonas sp.]|uniref:outer membrane protein assembly factor BamD n=1 Tax=Geomonas sp. TaxID=2651584 RepID=UPI002B499242|nr:outer membrane protein assembly factor BamD [Geomonas sp.]HJV35268.1 outer membrane protein assembly factor BamD [Geomonas sp.]
MSLRAVQYLAMITAVAVLAACASAPTPVKSAESNLKDADKAYAAHNYDEAIAGYKKVRESYSSAELTMEAELKIADAYYDNKSYIEAASAYEDFRKLHPLNPKAPYALYRAGLSHYYQITGIDTDQTPVKNAVTMLESFIAQYPDSEYVVAARAKLEDCKVKQLEYENYVANFYIRTDKYPSAIKRLKEALVRFPKSPELDQTLFLLGKAYLESGDAAQAKATLLQLQQQYPYSQYKEKAAKLLQKAAKMQGTFVGYSSHRS